MQPPNPEFTPDYEDLTPSIFLTWPLLLFTGILLFVSLLYGQRHLAVFTLLFVVLAVGIKCWSFGSSRRVHYRIRVERNRLFPGETTTLEIRVENKKILPVFVKARLSVDGFESMDRKTAAIEGESGLLWHQSVVFGKKMTAIKRGRYLARRPLVVTGDYFGLFPRKQPLNREVEIIVYPRRIILKPFPLLERILFGKPGRNSPVQDPVYILGTRDYQYAQPARHIHWKASAKHNRLQEKVFEPAEPGKTWLILDTEGFHDQGATHEFEKALEAIAALAAVLYEQNYAIGFMSNGGQPDKSPSVLSVSQNPGQLSAIFDLLAGMAMTPWGKIDDVRNTCPVISRDGTGVYFSLFGDRGASTFSGLGLPIIHIDCSTGSGNAPNGSEAAENPGPYFLDDICLEGTAK